MIETPKNQPIFHINQVGTINTGDVTIQGNQISSQINQALDILDAKITEIKRHPTHKLATLLRQILNPEPPPSHQSHPRRSRQTLPGRKCLR